MKLLEDCRMVAGGKGIDLLGVQEMVLLKLVLVHGVRNLNGRLMKLPRLQIHGKGFTLGKDIPPALPEE